MPDVATALELWDRLISVGTIRLGDYDQDIIDEVRLRMKINPSEQFRDALSSLPAEDLLRSLLSIVAPVAAMLKDLLALYENIAAQRTRDENIRMSFNFDEDSTPLDIDLTAFREWENNYRNVLRSTVCRRWSAQNSWQVTELLSQAAFTDPSFEREGWPAIDEDAPASGNTAVDAVLAKVWDLRKDFITEVSAVWPQRHAYQTSYFTKRDATDTFTLAWGDEAQEVRREAQIMVSDFWDLNTGAVVEAVARSVKFSEREAAPTAPNLARKILESGSKISDLIDEMPVVTHSVSEQVDNLESLLSLPVWGKRHEVYSAWIFTQIVGAIGYENLSFNVHKGRLSFDFGGADLAYFNSEAGTLHVWAELRTRSENPIGMGRKGGIQPDYSVTLDPVHEPTTTLLAVECKQYRKSALRTHADALVDYTTGLPQAAVILAAYGPVSPKAVARLSADAQSRARVVTHMRPGMQRDQRAFIAHVRASLPIPAGPVQTKSFSAIHAVLEWSTDVDLDISARLLDDLTTVDYKSQQAILKDGRVTLDHDATRGPGRETIIVATARPVLILVHVFTEGVTLSETDARLTIVTSSSEVAVPVEGSERWLSACIIHGERVEIIGRSGTHRP